MHRMDRHQVLIGPLLQVASTRYKIEKCDAYDYGTHAFTPLQDPAWVQNISWRVLARDSVVGCTWLGARGLDGNRLGGGSIRVSCVTDERGGREQGRKAARSGWKKGGVGGRCTRAGRTRARADCMNPCASVAAEPAATAVKGARAALALSTSRQIASLIALRCVGFRALFLVVLVCV
eukprot:1408589-Rhodomonas_salina.1